MNEAHDPFEQCAPPVPVPAPSPEVPAGRYKAVVPSTWTKEGTREKGTTWTEVGSAFKLKEQEGWIISIRANISISGTLLIVPLTARDL